MKKKNVFNVTLLLLFVLCLVCCTGGSTSKLVGKWAHEEAPPGVFIEFFNDGSGTFYEDKFTWTATESGRLTLKIEGGPRDTFDYKISGSTLTITIEGEDMNLRRK